MYLPCNASLGLLYFLAVFCPLLVDSLETWRILMAEVDRSNIVERLDEQGRLRVEGSGLEMENGVVGVSA